MSRKVALTTLSRCAMLVAGLASSVITARTLGPAGRGEYFFIVTLAATVVQFANLGLHSSNTYFVSKDRNALAALLGNSFWASLGVGLVAAGIAVAVLRLFDPIPNARHAHVWYVVALVPPLLFFLLGANLLVGIDRIGTFNVIEAAGRLAVLAAFAVTALVATTASAFLAASAIAWILVSGILIVVLKRLARGPLRLDTAMFTAGFRYAAKAYLVSLLGFLVLRSSVFLLERMTTSKEVGYFSVASQIADVLAIIPTSVALVLFPDLVRDERRRWALTMRSCAVVFVVLSAACIVVGFVAGPVIRIVFGHGFAPSVGVLQWLLPGVVGLGVTSVVSQYLAAVGMPRIVIWVWLGDLVCAGLVGFLLIRRNGGVGAAEALSITYWIAFGAMLAVSYRYRRRLDDAGRPDAVPVDPEPEPPWL